MIVKLGVVYILYSHLDALLLRSLSLVFFFLLLNTAVQDFVDFLESLGHSWFLRLDHNLRQNGRLSVLNFSASVSAAVIQSFYFFFLHKSCLSFGILRFNSRVISYLFDVIDIKTHGNIRIFILCRLGFLYLEEGLRRCTILVVLS